MRPWGQAKIDGRADAVRSAAESEGQVVVALLKSDARALAVPPAPTARPGIGAGGLVMRAAGAVLSLCTS
jgi:hypothetical protein